MRLEILSGKDIKEIHQMLEKKYGFKQKLDYGFLKSGKGKQGRIWICSKDLRSFKLKNMNVETVGLYFCFKEKTRLRLSIEGAQLIGKHATKNVININKEQVEKWIRGFDLVIDKNPNLEKGYVILKLGKSVIGCGKYRKNKILNIVRKSRRIKKL